MSANYLDAVARVRPMVANDLDAVVAIENASYDFPWGRAIFNDCLLAGYNCYVGESQGFVVGYAILSVAAAEGHILNLCVNPPARRAGMGSMLLETLLDRSEALQVERLFLEVRPSNPAAIKLYEDAGFTRLGVRRNYYKAHEGREDALVLVKDFRGV